MLKAHGDWMELGAADEQKEPRRARSRPGVARRTIRWAASTACARATGAASACTSRHCMEALGLAELTHEKRGNRACAAI